MPKNPYEELFDDQEKRNSKPEPLKDPAMAFSAPLEEFIPSEDLTEPLDAILAQIASFNKEAEVFSQLLSKTRAVDHKVTSNLKRLFVSADDPHIKGSLAGERDYHRLLRQKFNTIIEPMRELAALHLKTVKRYNLDIDKNYYSVEKSDAQIKLDLETATKGLNLQRRILADAAGDLQMLHLALEDCERRIRGYVDAGGENNISTAEYQLVQQQRQSLSTGKDHGFDYRFFNLNLLDKAVISWGGYLQETTNGYISKLTTALSI